VYICDECVELRKLKRCEDAVQIATTVLGERGQEGRS
jgi:hypothetical protein